MPGILWLASYPKSGNTWLRAFLANYMTDPSTPVAINDLPQFCFGDAAAEYYEQVAGHSVVDASLEEIQALRLKVHAYFSQLSADTVFVKTHNAVAFLDDLPTINAEVTVGALYVIRNPLDVVLSYAHQYGVTVDRAIDVLQDEDALLPAHGNVMPQYLHSWSGHVQSWLDAPGLRLHVVRYEDMARRPFPTFRAVVDFLGLPLARDRLNKAIRFSAFGELSGQESERGFVEAPPIAGRTFFRKGEVGGWRREMTESQVSTLVDAHRAMMIEFGYLDGQGRPVGR